MTIVGEFAPALELRTTREGQTITVYVRGYIDLDTYLQLALLVDVAVGRGGRHIIIDLSGVSFMDASALRAIVHSAHTLAPSHGSLLLRTPSAMARKIIDLAGLSHLIELAAPKLRLPVR